MTAASTAMNQGAGRKEMDGITKNAAHQRGPRFPVGLRTTRSEAKRLNRRSFAGVGLGLLVFFSLMTTVVTFVAGGQIGPGGAFGTQTDLASAQGLVAGLVTGVDVFGILTLSLWAAATASDFSTGWVRVMVQAEPRRWRLFGGKLLALATYTVVGMAAATVVSVALAPALAGVAGVSTNAWWTGAIGSVVNTWANITLAVLAWGVIGVALATVTRSVTAAVAGGIGYLMVVEGLLSMVLDTAITTYLPGSVLGAIASAGTASLAYGFALSLGLAYATLAIVIAGVTFARRDITS